jgi:hypothetical protein
MNIYTSIYDSIDKKPIVYRQTLEINDYICFREKYITPTPSFLKKIAEGDLE